MAPRVASTGVGVVRGRTGGMSERGSFSQMTGMRSGYFSRMRMASSHSSLTPIRSAVHPLLGEYVLRMSRVLNDANWMRPSG